MARSRVIKPEFFDDEKLASVSRDCRLFFVGIWKCSDDYAVVKGHPVWLKNNIFPYDEDISKADIEGWLQLLYHIDAIIPFEHNAEKYYFITNFHKHQKVDKPSKSRNPEPPEDISDQKFSNVRECVASVSRVSIDETETETETETEINTLSKPTGSDRKNSKSNFQIFWNVWPNKVGKDAALKSWQKRKDLPELEIILAAIQKQIDWRNNSHGRFRPEWKNPATWINQGCWDDECDPGYGSSAPTKNNPMTQIEQEIIAEWNSKNLEQL